MRVQSSTLNLVNADATITVSSSVAAAPKSNLYDQYLSNFLLFTGKTFETITLDAGSGNTIDFNSVGLAGGNLTENAVVTIEANATDSWGSPSVDETMTYNAEAWTFFFEALQQYRFVRITFVDTGNTGNIEIGWLFVGEYTQLDNFGNLYSENFDLNSTVNFTASGQVSGSFDYIARIVSLSFNYLSLADKKIIVNTYKSIYNFKTAIFTFLEDDTTEILDPMYGVINMNVLEVPKLKYRGPRYNINIEMREAK